MIFGFFGKKKAQQRQGILLICADLESEREGLSIELELLEKKMNVELSDDQMDRTTTRSRYPKRIVELRIQIDAIDRKLKALSDS
ncbi:MAG: hypothetical protein OSB09_07995 [Planctomycetota bacterium]|nr:hypothetical protein [Planctomycetota bacterium]